MHDVIDLNMAFVSDTVHCGGRTKHGNIRLRMNCS